MGAGHVPGSVCQDQFVLGLAPDEQPVWFDVTFTKRPTLGEAPELARPIYNEAIGFPRSLKLSRSGLIHRGWQIFVNTYVDYGAPTISCLSLGLKTLQLVHRSVK